MASDWTNKGLPRAAVLAFALACICQAKATGITTAKVAVAAKAAAAPKAAAFKFVPPVFSQRDSLFLAAATGEPRFKPLRDSAEKALIAADTATLNYLLAKRLLDQTPRQRHYVETLFKAISDSGRNHAPVTALAAALSGAADSVKVQLLHIGSELGDSSFLPVARQFLAHDSVEVRKTAVRCLGSYPSPANAPLLLDGLEKTRDLERQARLWALDKQSGIADWPRLLPLLGDENLYNRQLARRIVGKAAGDWALLAKYIPADSDPEDQEAWVLLALETPGPAAKAYVRKTLPALEPEMRRFIESGMPRPMRNLRQAPAPETEPAAVIPAPSRSGSSSKDPAPSRP